MSKTKKRNNILVVDKPRQLLKVEENTSSKKAGRKPIPVAQKGTEMISIKVTAEQKRIIQEKAGLIPIATFIKDVLKKSGNLSSV